MPIYKTLKFAAALHRGRASFLTIPRAAQVLEVTFPTAQSNMKKLEDPGILHEITGHKRNRIYQGREILALLDAVPAEEETK